MCASLADLAFAGKLAQNKHQIKHSSIYGSKICRHNHRQKKTPKQSKEITFFFWQAKRKQRISLGRHTADSVLLKSISLNAYREHQRVLLTVRHPVRFKRKLSQNTETVC